MPGYLDQHARHQFAFCPHGVCKCIPQNWSSEKTSEQSSAMQLSRLNLFEAKCEMEIFVHAVLGGKVLASNNSVG